MSETVRRERPATPRTAARLAAVQALYQLELTGAALDVVVREFLDHRLGQAVDGEQYRPADETLFADLVEGAWQHLEVLDGLIAEALSTDWTVGRLDSVLRALLRAACYELARRTDIPVRVVINEYVDLAHAFFEGKETGLANGVLERIGRSQRREEWS